MAIFHLSAKPLGRRNGRSAVAAAAYRAAARLSDARTGIVYDFRRRRGVLHSAIVTPSGSGTWASDRSQLWSAAELAEVRSDARTAREIEVALPAELTTEAQVELAMHLARELADRHCVAVDVAVHAPGRGDQRNFHAHLLLTTRQITAERLGKKTREWDDRKTGPTTILWWRERWAQIMNAALKAVGVESTVDHRSLADQGIEREPGMHLGPHAAAFERRTGMPSRRREAAQHRAIHGRSVGREKLPPMDDQKGRSEVEHSLQMAAAINSRRPKRRTDINPIPPSPSKSMREFKP